MSSTAEPPDDFFPGPVFDMRISATAEAVERTEAGTYIFRYRLHDAAGVAIHQGEAEIDAAALDDVPHLTNAVMVEAMRKAIVRSLRFPRERRESGQIMKA